MLKRILTASIVLVLPLTLSAQYSDQQDSGVPAYNKTLPAKVFTWTSLK